MNKSFAIILLFCIIFLAPWAAAASGESKISDSFTLKNGMQVVVIQNHIVPAVTHMVWYKTGSASDPPGKSGIAHFLEHLMFKGTQKIKSGDFSKIVAEHGGNDNAFTSLDYTVYHQTIAREYLELVMDMESDRMKNLILGKDEVAKELQVVLEERNMRVETSPRSMLVEKINGKLFAGHPYAVPVIGHRAEIEKLTLEDALDFYKKNYSPENAILVVSGDISAGELKPLAEKYYGSIPANPAASSTASRLLSKNSHWKTIESATVSLEHENVSGPEWLKYYVAPSLNTEDAEYAYPLILLAYIMGNDNSSRLYNSLVVEQSLAVYASTSYDDISRGPSYFAIHAIPAPGVTVGTIDTAVKNEIKQLLDKGITESELDQAKTQLVASSIYARDGISSIAHIFGEITASGLPISYFDDWEKNINAVTTEQVNNAAKHLFIQMPHITGRLLPAKK